MNILLSGVTGFLGSHLARALLKANYTVIALKRSYSDKNNIEDIVHKLRFYDIDRSGIQLSFDEHPIDVVIHAATLYGRENNKRSDIENANVLFPLQLMDLAVEKGCQAFINTDTFFNTEENAYGYLNSYILSKKHFKEWLQTVDPEQKMKRINLRLQHVFGPADRPNKFVPWLMKQLLDNVETVLLTPGEQKRDFIYIQDAVTAYLAVLNNLSQINGYWQSDVGSGSPLMLKQFIEMCWTSCKKNYKPQLLTKLNFGALPYRQNEFFNVDENIQPLTSLGWIPEMDIETGIKYTFKNLFESAKYDRTK